MKDTAYVFAIAVLFLVAGIQLVQVQLLKAEIAINESKVEAAKAKITVNAANAYEVQNLIQDWHRLNFKLKALEMNRYERRDVPGLSYAR